MSSGSGTAISARAALARSRPEAYPRHADRVRRRVVDTGGWLSYQQGDLAEAEALLSEAVSLHRASGDSMSHAWALGRLADVALSQWEPERARDLLEEARQIGHAIGNPLIETAALSDLGRVLLISGDAAAAEATLREALRQQQAMPGTIGAAVSTLFLEARCRPGQDPGGRRRVWRGARGVRCGEDQPT